MKKEEINKIFLVFSFYLFTCLSINAQTKSWSTTNPFQTNVFVQNFGQFDNWVKSDEPIKYVVNNSSKVFFTAHGLVYKLTKVEMLSEDEREEMERKEGKEARPKAETYYVNMNWEGSNPDVTIEVAEQAEGYYTFGEKGYENIKAKGYRKLTYKNLYNNIDVEYIIPKKGGIKYSIILHEGADLSKVKMLYNGDAEKINKDNEGNIIIATPAGNITDHAPKSFYDSTKEDIKSSFELKQNIVSFQLITHNSSLITIIDPWTTMPTSLDSSYAFDIASDDFGNVYVSGGTTPYKISKYTNNGSFLWSFTYPLGWSSAYSKFCIIHTSGTIFIGESLANGPRVMKLNSNGTLTFTSTPFTGNSEIWVMCYNLNTGQLIGFGGGINNANNLQQITDTNLTNSNIYNTNGFMGTRNDIASAVMDNNGDFYVLLSSPVNPNSNNIQKSLFSTNYAPPLAFNVYTGYYFIELNNDGIPELTHSTVRANALALNNNYLFSYDGRTLKGWDKINGIMLDSIIVNTEYCTIYTGLTFIAEGRWRTHEGIAVDSCNNNIWVGGHDTVHVYSFNGTNFIAGTPITQNINGEVYDINYNSSLNLLAVCGNGFVSTFNVNPCIHDKINKNNLMTQKVYIFPNPSNNSFTIKTPKDTKYIEVSNLFGKVIEKKIINNEIELNFKINESGIYIIKVYTNKGIIIKKVIISNN